MQQSKTKEKDFIPGIYNYCDNWCERCTFRHRCRSFFDRTEEELKLSAAGNISGAMQELKKAKKLLRKSAKENGIDIDNISKREIREMEEREQRLLQEIKRHPIYKVAFEYVESVLRFVYGDTAGRFNESEIFFKFDMELKTGQDPNTIFRAIQDNLEIVMQYHTFILIKFMRALRGLVGGDNWLAEDGKLRDYDGSAKVALIATQRSLDAWMKFRELIPEKDDVTLNLLAKLKKIERLGKETFPNAMKFVRPGFDE